MTGEAPTEVRGGSFGVSFSRQIGGLDLRGNSADVRFLLCDPANCRLWLGYSADSGSGESWFDPRRGNLLQLRARQCVMRCRAPSFPRRVAIRVSVRRAHRRRDDLVVPVRVARDCEYVGVIGTRSTMRLVRSASPFLASPRSNTACYRWCTECACWRNRSVPPRHWRPEAPDLSRSGSVSHHQVTRRCENRNCQLQASSCRFRQRNDKASGSK